MLAYPFHPARNPIRPPWVMKDAAIDLWFARQRYFGARAAYKSSDRTGCLAPQIFGSSGVICAPDSTGIVKIFNSFTPRITNGCGLWADKNTTNSVLQSRDLSTTWTNVGGNSTVAKDQVGADNGPANSASSMLANAANARVSQPITLASTDFVFWCYMKRITGTGAINMTMDNFATKTDVSGSINSSTWTKVAIPYQTLANPTVGFEIVTSGDKIAVDMCMGENSQFATTPLITTTTTKARGTDETQLGSNGVDSTKNDGIRIIHNLCFNTPVTVYSEFSRAAVGNIALLFQGSVTSLMFQNSATGAASIQNTATSIITTANTMDVGLGTVNKAAAAVRGNNASVCLNGGTVATGSGRHIVDTDYDHMGIGNNGGGTNALHGYTSRLVIWHRALSDGELQAITTR